MSAPVLNNLYLVHNKAHQAGHIYKMVVVAPSEAAARKIHPEDRPFCGFYARSDGRDGTHCWPALEHCERDLGVLLLGAASPRAGYGAGEVILMF